MDIVMNIFMDIVMDIFMDIVMYIFMDSFGSASSCTSSWTVLALHLFGHLHEQHWFFISMYSFDFISLVQRNTH